MTPDVVVDVGNTRIKWGRCSSTGDALVQSLSVAAEPAFWQEHFSAWNPLNEPWQWVLTSVRPPSCLAFQQWLEARGQQVHHLERAAQLPLRVNVPKPDHVGIDRLLDAVAAQRRLSLGQAAILIDAGSAVTVDWLDEEHIFQGGTIFPGVRLMAEALHAYTALLPLVRVTAPIPDVPAKNTTQAMEAGIFHTVAGGIVRIAEQLRQQTTTPPVCFLTGGDARLLSPALAETLTPILWPDQTLEGILACVRGAGS